MNPQHDENNIVLSQKTANLLLLIGFIFLALGLALCRLNLDTIWLLVGSFLIISSPILLALGFCARPGSNPGIGDLVARGIARFIFISLGVLVLVLCFQYLHAPIGIMQIIFGFFGSFLVLVGLGGQTLTSRILSFLDFVPEKIYGYVFRGICLYISFSCIMILAGGGKFASLLKDDPATVIRLGSGSLTFLAFAVGVDPWKLFSLSRKK